MGGTADLLDAIVAAAHADTPRAHALLTPVLADPAVSPALEARALAVLGFVEYLDANYTGAIVVAERAVTIARDSGDAEALIYALGSRLLASGGTPWAGSGPDVDHFALAWELRDQLADLEPESRMIAGHLLVEGMFCLGRLTEAAELLDGLVGVRESRSPENERRQPYPACLLLQWPRVAFFQGRLGESLTAVEAVMAETAETGDTLWNTLAQCYLALIAAYQGDKPTARHYLAGQFDAFPEADGYLTAAVYALCGYALFAIGDLQRAAEVAERGGGDAELTNLQVADRAICYDILVTAALARGDLASAEEWGRRSIALAAHPAAIGIVEQLLARIDLSRGDALSGAERASIAAARSRLTGRYLDAARSDLFRAEALAAGGLHSTAVRELTDVAHRSNRNGLYSYGRAATAELRRLGRRLPPETGSGWNALSERERQIAVLAAEGFSNRVIADTLFLSDRTVQSHLSRVLAALNAPSRAALPARVGGRLGRPQDDLPELTPRQWAVARHLAEGESNRVIAEALSISIKTVEKHVGEILSRWGMSSRTAVASVLAGEVAHLALTQPVRVVGQQGRETARLSTSHFPTVGRG
ncbi:MAG: LuxR C-terminal-related transcriptional regulator [Rhodoglobus sp.]